MTAPAHSARLQHLNLGPTSGRLTPRQDFSVVLSTAASVVGRVAGMTLGAALPGGALSAAVSQTVGAVGEMSRLTSRGVSPIAPLNPGSPSTSGSVGGLESGGQADLLETQRLMQQESFAFSAQYLQMQDAMQRESRQFNAVSNIMKVRHDSAKAAINNIR